MQLIHGSFPLKSVPALCRERKAASNKAACWAEDSRWLRKSWFQVQMEGVNSTVSTEWQTSEQSMIAPHTEIRL